MTIKKMVNEVCREISEEVLKGLIKNYILSLTASNTKPDNAEMQETVKQYEQALEDYENILPEFKVDEFADKVVRAMNGRKDEK